MSAAVPHGKSLVAFDQALRSIVSTEARPFLCDGNPYDCRVFVVGLNPRTHTDFWSCWDTTHGCSKQRWLEAYLAKEKRFGPTRANIEHVLEALSPVKCLEANLFDAWSQRLSDLPREKRSTSVFEFLLDEIRPEVILAHGRPVVGYLEETMDHELTLNELQQVTLHGRRVAVYARHHLSFQTSRAECRRIGLLLKEYVTTRGGE